MDWCFKKIDLSLHLHPLYVCTISDDSREPAHMRTLCRNYVIKGVYEWRYLLFDFDIYRICLCYCMLIMGLEALDLCLHLHAPLFFMCAQTTMDLMCVRAGNALVRLCICPGLSELMMFAIQTRLSY